MAKGIIDPAKVAHTTTRRRADGVLSTDLVGVMTGPIIAQMGKDVVGQWRDGADRVWYVDARLVPSFTTDIADPASKFLLELRAKKVSPIVVAMISNMAVRMMARGLCFGAGIKLRALETPAEGEAALRELLLKSA